MVRTRVGYKREDENDHWFNNECCESKMRMYTGETSRDRRYNHATATITLHSRYRHSCATWPHCRPTVAALPRTNSSTVDGYAAANSVPI